MNFWTIQSKKVIKIIEEKDIYNPNIKKSTYLDKFKETLNTEFDLYKGNLRLYQFITSCACTINNYYSLNGVIFCFCKFENGLITDFKDQAEFYTYLLNRKETIKSLWKNLHSSDSILLQLNFNEKFWNPLFIDINDYQYLMPPFIPIPPYGENEFYKIKNNILQGICQPIFNSGIIQAHLPYITKSMIKGVFQFN